MTETIEARVDRLISAVTLADNFEVRVGTDTKGLFIQIKCYRKDVITGDWDWGFGGKYHPSEHASDSEIMNATFGLYKGYVEHEARETFQWEGRRIYGPHMDIRALHEVARRVDLRSAQHEDALA
jgi:hypothetical protein